MLVFRRTRDQSEWLVAVRVSLSVALQRADGHTSGDKETPEYGTANSLALRRSSDHAHRQ